MAVFKCKMCGGQLEISEGITVCTCDYCGTEQTLPRLDSDKKANMYDRANHFRRNNDYDKAMSIYEQILNEDNTDAEAYWSLVLCKYGIEYVEDPVTHKRITTINRSQYTSIYADENYKSALQFSDIHQRTVYEQEAKTIDNIQKGILAISEKEEPFDVFICYKETDANGRRTQDSVLANDLYHQLTQEGFKVFFAKITLEDKLGQEYEPYIFAALNSAKAMVVLGTKPEYFNAVWVKNEWSRYLALISAGEKKILIPAYRDMDPYDLPEEFSHLQAQDMSKLGFMQDLIRGIKKIVQTEEDKKQESYVINNPGINIEPLLKRMFIFLEDGDWEKADEFCEQILNQDPENEYAYLGKLMAELKIRKRELLGEYYEGFENNQYYIKVRRYADKFLNAELDEYIKNIKDTNNENKYLSSSKMMKLAESEKEFIRAAEEFELLGNYKNAKALASECRDKADVSRKNEIYAEAVRIKRKGSEIDLQKAIELFEQISDWKDSAELIADCKEIIKRINIGNIRKKKIIKAIVAAIICGCITIVTVLVIINSINNKKAQNILLDRIKVANVGDKVELGTYEQDNDITNGKENIEWIVLAKEDDKMLLISKKALDYKKYNETSGYATWESCSLRSWLNNTFFKEAFSGVEQKIIENTAVSVDKYNDYCSDSGRETIDKVFLLSLTEAKKYFANDKQRTCIPTSYTFSQLSEISRRTTKKLETVRWWTRNSAKDLYEACLINYNGDIDSYHGIIMRQDADECSFVRPAIWVNLKP